LEEKREEICFVKFKFNSTSALHNKAVRHEDVWGSGGIAPRIFSLGAIWMWVVSFTPRPLYHGERATCIRL